MDDMALLRFCPVQLLQYKLKHLEVFISSKINVCHIFRPSFSDMQLECELTMYTYVPTRFGQRFFVHISYFQLFNFMYLLYFRGKGSSKGFVISFLMFDNCSGNNVGNI